MGLVLGGMLPLLFTVCFWSTVVLNPTTMGMHWGLKILRVHGTGLTVGEYTGLGDASKRLMTVP